MKYQLPGIDSYGFCDNIKSARQMCIDNMTIQGDIPRFVFPLIITRIATVDVGTDMSQL